MLHVHIVPTIPKAEWPPPVFCTIVALRLKPFCCRSRNMSQQMGDSHRRFLQTMMGCAVVTGREADALYRYCCEVHNSESLQF